MNREEIKDSGGRSWEELWLDEALTHYGVAEPRPGLETRILAKLEMSALRRQRRWTFAFAAATAVLFVALMVSLRHTKSPTAPNVALRTQPSPSTAVFPDAGNIVVAQSSKAGGQLVREHHAIASGDRQNAGMTQGRPASNADASTSQPDNADVAEREPSASTPSASNMDESNTEAPSSDVVAQQQSTESATSSAPAASPAQEPSMPEIRISGLNIKPIQIKEISSGKTTD
jgi:hypothetical protein